MSYLEFLEQHQLSSEELWDKFYQFNESRIEIKKASVAKEKLARILNATFKLSHEQGFALMSLRDLSRETKLSLGGIYSYIKSKEHLSLMIHEFLPFMFGLIINSDELLEDRSLSRKERVKFIVRDHLYLSEFMHEWFFFAYMEAKYTSINIRKVARSNEAMSENLLLEALCVSQHDISDANKKEAWLQVMSLKSLLQSWYLKKRVLNQKNISVDDYLIYLWTVVDNLSITQND